MFSKFGGRGLALEGRGGRGCLDVANTEKAADSPRSTRVSRDGVAAKDITRIRWRACSDLTLDHVVGDHHVGTRHSESRAERKEDQGEQDEELHGYRVSEMRVTSLASCRVSKSRKICER